MQITTLPMVDSYEECGGGGVVSKLLLLLMEHELLELGFTFLPSYALFSRRADDHLLNFVGSFDLNSLGLDSRWNTGFRLLLNLLLDDYIRGVHVNHLSFILLRLVSRRGYLECGSRGRHLA